MPDIQLIGQWRATCSLATLWQCFGRAARDMSLVGVAILFCECEYFDQYRKEKEIKKNQRAAQKKRKAMNILVSATSKRHCNKRNCSGSNVGDTLPAGSNNLGREESEQVSDSSDDEIEFARMPLVTGIANERNLHIGDDDWVWAEIRARKVKGVCGQERKRVNQQEAGLEPAMDWFINADVRPGVGCRRKVVNVFFENDAAGETFHFWSPLLSN